MPRSLSAKVDVLSEILGDTTRSLAVVFEQMEWAEDEIGRAMRRRPDAADTLYHSFLLLTPTAERMSTEFVYRSHCREVLDRVLTGADTRLGTAAEVCLACMEASKIAPLTTASVGLYFRMWAAAFPEQPNFGGDQLHHYEALKGSVIDDLETTMRRKLTVADRRLGSIDCRGRHHGQDVNCTYATSHRADQAHGQAAA